MTQTGPKYDAAKNYQRMADEIARLRAENAALRNAITFLTEAVFDVAQKAAGAHQMAHQLGQQLTDDQGEPE